MKAWSAAAEPQIALIATFSSSESLDLGVSAFAKDFLRYLVMKVLLASQLHWNYSQ